MKSYAEFIAYFRHLAAANARLKDFLVGNSERILNRTTAEIRYPCLWLEDPEITFEENDLTGIFFDASFVVLINAEPGDWQAEDYNLESCFQIAQHLINKMRFDAREGVFEIEGQISLDRIHTLTADADWGWRASFRLRAEVGDCVDECQWTNICPAGALAAFSWKVVADGTFDGLIIENETLPEGDWEFTWRWIIDGGSEQTSEDELPAISGDGDCLMLMLTATWDDCIREASAFIRSEVSCGRSLPYCYNPST